MMNDELKTKKEGKRTTLFQTSHFWKIGNAPTANDELKTKTKKRKGNG